MKALITGIDGFTGRYVANRLKSTGCQVYGLSRNPWSHPDVDRVFVADLLDSMALRDSIKQVVPDWIVHLAGVSFVGHGNVDDIYKTNVIGTRNLLQAIVDSGCAVKSILLASSANVYGNSDVAFIDESVAAQPANDYAVSKLAMEYVARLYTDRLPIVITRPFNYTGVGQAASFLLPKIVGEFAKRAKFIELGNLDVAREFSDVRMVAECYGQLLECSSAIGGVFNICSGRAYSVEEVLDLARSICGHSLEIRVNSAFVRANEIKILRGSRARLETVIGPVKDFSLEETLRWMMGNLCA